MSEIEDAKKKFGEITEGLKLLGGALAAESRSEIHALLGKYATVQDGDLLEKLDVICQEARETGEDSRLFHYKLIVERLYLPMLTYEGPAANRWQNTAAVLSRPGRHRCPPAFRHR